MIARELIDALAEYSRQSDARLDDLYDEALRDLLKKKGHPASLKDALQLSTRQRPANDRVPMKRTRKGR